MHPLWTDRPLADHQHGLKSRSHLPPTWVWVTVNAHIPQPTSLSPRKTVTSLCRHSRQVNSHSELSEEQSQALMFAFIGTKIKVKTHFYCQCRGTPGSLQIYDGSAALSELPGRSETEAIAAAGEKTDLSDCHRDSGLLWDQSVTDLLHCRSPTGAQPLGCWRA